MKATRTTGSEPGRIGAAANHAARPRSPNSPKSGLAAAIGSSPHVVAQRQQLDTAFGPAIQRLEEDEELQMTAGPGVVQRQEPPPAPNNTGMPDGLKAGIESLSGMDMSEVRVHANSAKPDQLDAVAYAQGNDIHLGPGQEKHLPHEAWHAVQQKQGRVRPTLQEKGAAINDDAHLEREADVMGGRAASMPVSGSEPVVQAKPSQHNPASAPVQREPVDHRKADDQLENYVNALADLVDRAAENMLAVDNVPEDKGGMYDRWTAEASEYLADNTTVPNFIYTAYGYAIEKSVTDNRDSISAQLPHGWTVTPQVTHGMTRPDLVVFDAGREKAWLDITSENSMGHIFAKSGGGWNSKDYVYEITYTPLDLGRITSSGDMYAGIKARRTHQSLEKKKELAFQKLATDVQAISDLHDPTTLPETKACFEDYFDNEYTFSHNTIRSLIELAGEDLAPFGYRRARANGRDRPTAMEFIYSQYINNISLFY